MLTAAPLSMTGEADVAAVGASAVAFTLVMKPGERYRLTTNASMWFRQSTDTTANPAAKATAPSVYLAAGAEVTLTTSLAGAGTKLSVIQDGASTGFASLARVVVGR